MAGADQPGGLRVLVVDDERPALEDLAYLLRQQPAIGAVMTADNTTDALRCLRDDHFDGVFLDIRMPGLDGMELARILGRFANPPGIIFVSAFEQHALEAFELQAIDYLLKPVRPERLAHAIARIGSRPAATSAVEQPARVAVEVGGSTRLIDRDSIRFVETSGDYVRLHSDQGTYLVRTPISSLEESWSASGFVRVHRRYLVSLRHLTEMRGQPGGGYVVLVDGQELPVSRRHLRDVRDRLHGLPPSRP